MSLTTIDGTPISRFAFGAMQFGGKADEAASRAMFDACRAAGINHFDTAHAYNNGQSEEILGGCITDRDQVFIATKAIYSGGSAPDNIRKSFDESSRRLGLETVDLFYMHRWDDRTPLEETFKALAELQHQKRIRYIGVSNYAAWQVMKAQAVAAEFGTEIDAIQPMYNLVKRQAEVELLPMCASEYITAFPYSPLGGGLLTGKYANGQAGRLAEDTKYAQRYGPDWMQDAAAGLTDIARELGTHPATLAVAWAARHSAAPHPIISARSVAQLQPSLDALAFAMDDALYQRLTDLTPTPPPATDRLEEA
ncbi:aldo/keto reductase [Marinovum sp. 2_MG-2023]|uniref:aldo/keto reductase n=1 Tax=unclassified Marinovum TaxID=2647166 RepID=UPI0026E33171|nr:MULTISPECIES: aldo/keto reductase [unclassified Marinovum]MDO6730222.1 aldo/keto reductase [Marinovum sp. 2_MG-2023]MDO6778960.1 aldo/keto reductase [Marinovum sp. 1_MG-2023]